MIRLDKPKECYFSGCPLAACRCGHPLEKHDLETGACLTVDVKEKKHGRGKKAIVERTETACECKEFRSKGTGFVLGTGDAKNATIALWLEAPGNEEIAYRLGSDIKKREFDSDELARREADYPNIDGKFRRLGAPLVGKSGRMTDSWSLEPTGIARESLFIDNTLRCMPPKRKNSNYPIGAERKLAETCCRQYDRWDKFGADLVVLGIHPAAILREITPLPLLNQATLKRAKDFSNQGYRVIVALGGKAAKAVLHYGENITRYLGHYAWLKK